VREEQRADGRRRTKRSNLAFAIATVSIPVRSEGRKTPVNTQNLLHYTVFTKLSASPNRVNPDNPSIRHATDRMAHCNPAISFYPAALPHRAPRRSREV
jgi:hypothetical protein